MAMLSSTAETPSCGWRSSRGLASCHRARASGAGAARRCRAAPARYGIRERGIRFVPSARERTVTRSLAPVLAKDRLEVVGDRVLRQRHLPGESPGVAAGGDE